MNSISQESNGKLKGIADICILLDATASMQPCIDDIKENIHTLIRCINHPEENGGIEVKDWRACVWGYRDYTYDPQHGLDAIVKQNFTRDVDELKDQLTNLRAMGGGPTPESLLDALMEVCLMGNTERNEPIEPDKWRACGDAARCVIVITDAPYHQKLETMPSATLQDVIDFVEQQRIRLSIYAPELDCYYNLSVLDGSEYMPVELPCDVGEDEDGNPDPRVCVQALRDFTSDKEHFGRTMLQLGQTIAQASSDETEYISGQEILEGSSGISSEKYTASAGGVNREDEMAADHTDEELLEELEEE